MKSMLFHIDSKSYPICSYGCSNCSLHKEKIEKWEENENLRMEFENLYEKSMDFKNLPSAEEIFEMVTI